MADSLKWTSALSVALAVVFVVIVVAVTLWKLVAGQINWPRLMPDVSDLASFWRLFTVIPIMMTAYICHHNGKFLLVSSFSVSLPLLPLSIPI
jgi:sodium-coupled neutral amino acid transporter 2